MNAIRKCTALRPSMMCLLQPARFSLVQPPSMPAANGLSCPLHLRGLHLSREAGRSAAAYNSVWDQNSLNLENNFKNCLRKKIHQTNILLKKLLENNGSGKFLESVGSMFGEFSSSILHLLPLIYPVFTCVDLDPYWEYGSGEVPRIIILR